jgi:hypothetical protein
MARFDTFFQMNDPRTGPSLKLAKNPGRRFCPRCRKSFRAAAEIALCPDCGDRLASSGYCAVCEDYWTLAAGAPCPKHDLPLSAERPSSPELETSADAVRWVTVCYYSDGPSAMAPRIRLEAEGIPTFLDGERMGEATGGVFLKVPQALANEARVILAQTWSALAAELGIEDENDLEQEREPKSFQLPERAELEPAPSLRHALFLLLSAGLPALALVYWFLRLANHP